MAKDYISIQDAAELSNKSIQTIRRAVKAKKLNVRKKKTPQGFNYMVSKDSLTKVYGVKFEEEGKKTEKTQKKVQSEKVTSQKPKAEASDKSISVDTDDFKQLVKTLDTLVHRHSDERQNFLRLVDSLNERIFVLENQINLLKAPADESKWYQFWK